MWILHIETDYSKWNVNEIKYFIFSKLVSYIRDDLLLFIYPMFLFMKVIKLLDILVILIVPFIYTYIYIIIDDYKSFDFYLDNKNRKQDFLQLNE